MWDLPLVEPPVAVEPPDALDELDEAAEDRDAWITFVGADRAFAPLRGEPRFQDLLRRVLGGDQSAVARV